VASAGVEASTPSQPFRRAHTAAPLKRDQIIRLPETAFRAALGPAPQKG
jgi:hypothetical protein